MKIHCPICKEIFQETDILLMDKINTLIHTHCYTEDYGSISDKGTYKELTEKYTFLQEVVH